MTPEKLFHYQHFMQNLLAYACNGILGRSEIDPVYQDVVEKRDGPSPQMRAKYSSCGDLPMWAYFRAGCRNAFINRAEHNGWVMGANLNRWVGKPIGPNPFAVKPGREYPLDDADCFAPGDVVVINNAWGGHVMVAMLYDQRTKTLHTAEYGKPGGKFGVHVIERAREGRDGLQLRSGNQLISHVKFKDVLEAGGLEPPDIDVLKNWQAAEVLETFKRELL